MNNKVDRFDLIMTIDTQTVQIKQNVVWNPYKFRSVPRLTSLQIKMSLVYFAFIFVGSVVVFLLLVLSFGGIVIDRLSAAIIVVRKTTRDSLTHIDFKSMRPMKRSRKKH